ncbi:MAG: hypothetical protein ACOC36_06570 [Fibrobacterota bacterium]
MSVFEAAMLVCFGISWPISIAKALRTRTVSGKSPLFMTIVIAGYTSGVLHKLLFSRDWVILLYATNLVLVSIDLMLYYRYSRRTPADYRQKAQP